MNTTDTVLKEKPLVVADVSTLKAENVNKDFAGVEKEVVDPVLEKKADDFLAKLLNAESIDVQRASIDNIGAETAGMVGKSEMLQGQIRELANKGADGGEIAKSILDLKNQVEELDPNQFDFNNPKNFFIRFMRKFPLVGSPLQRYFEKYMTAQEVIDAIIKSLEHGRGVLERDMRILGADQEKMRQYKDRLIEIIKFMTIIDKKLDDAAFSAETDDAEKANFIRQELLFPNRQRLGDMRQLLLVNEESIMTIEIIIRNNRELVRGVNRALNVTIQALKVAVTLSFALAHQQIVLDKITALNTVTDNLLLGTSAKLRTTGVEIHKQASTTALSMDTLKQVFANIHAAMDDISKFRLEALPKMNKDIEDMRILSEEAEKTIKKMDAGNKAQAKITVDFGGEEFKVK